MFSLRQRQDGSFFLTYDKFRYPDRNVRGLWELVGKQYKLETDRLVKINRKAGYMCCDDDEGNVRALILTDGKYNDE